MLEAMLGKKLGMTRVFTDDGRWIPVTVVEAGPCTVVQRKSTEKDAYEAVQLGFGKANPRRLDKPMQGHFAKQGVEPVRYLVEFRVQAESELKSGDAITVDIFKVGDKVDVTGTSKGKGFQGVMKRHGFKGGPGAHGSHFHRRPGSIGSNTTPGRVLKGKRMGGRMGNETITTQGLEVVGVQPERNVLLIRGCVPGANGGLLTIRQTVKGK